MRAVLTIAVLTGFLATVAAAQPNTAGTGDTVPPCTEPAATEVAAFQEVNREIGEFLRRYREQEERIGENRRLRLEVARYHLGSEDYGRRLYDDRAALDETKDILRACVSKLLRERLERLAVDWAPDSFDPFRDPSDNAEDGLRLRFSPSVHLGHDPSLGAKLRLRGAGSFWDRWSLRYRQSLDEGNRFMALQYDDARRIVRLEHVLDVVHGDERVLVNVRWRF